MEPSPISDLTLSALQTALNASFDSLQALKSVDLVDFLGGIKYGGQLKSDLKFLN